MEERTLEFGCDWQVHTCSLDPGSGAGKLTPN